jgi:hypothetical protein
MASPWRNRSRKGYVMLVDGINISTSGKIIRIARVSAEGYEFIDDPPSFISEIKKNNIKADIFTFTQKLPDTNPIYRFYMEWDNVAALPITNFEHWWTKQLNDKTRNMIRRAEKKRVVVKVVDFDDEFARGITNIYNESPIRQGKPFWHYGKDFETVKKENATFLERSYFLGAYFEGEMIGFVKLVYEKNFASMMQIISMVKYRDKAPTNALVAKAVEICANNHIPYLVYAKFSAHNMKKRDALSDFKYHNRFMKIDIPRYYVPLTKKGDIAIMLKLHRDISQIFPEDVIIIMKNIRRKWYERRIQGKKSDRNVSKSTT